MGASREHKRGVYVVNDALQVACDHYCGNLHRKESSEGREGEAYLRPDHLLHLDRYTTFVGRSGRSLVGPQIVS